MKKFRRKKTEKAEGRTKEATHLVVAISPTSSFLFRPHGRRLGSGGFGAGVRGKIRLFDWGKLKPLFNSGLFGNSRGLRVVVVYSRVASELI